MREEKTDKIEVHAAGVCFLDNKVLICKRSNNREFYPGLWECGGGHVKKGETFQEALKRQLKEELGILVDVLDSFDTYHINNEVLGVRFTCRITGFVNGKSPSISKEHSEWKFLGMDELDNFEFIPGLKERIKQAYSKTREYI